MHLYQPDSEGMWKCLHSDVMIPFDRVNDDFCDCPDGSDEPGSGACGHVEDLTFYCANKGHIPARLPSDRVDDGVCDYDICCDGSDEPAGKCVNKCAEIHALYRKTQAKRAQMLEKALKTKANLVTKAQAVRAAQQEDANRMTTESKQMEQKLVVQRSELESLKQRAATDTEDSDDEFPEEIRLAVEKMTGLVDELHAAIEESALLNSERSSIENIMTTLQTDYNPNFNDPAVKGAIKAWQTIRSDSQVPLDKTPQINAELLSEIIQQLSQFRALSSSSSCLNGGVSCPSPSIWDALYNLFPSIVQTQLTIVRTWLIENAILAPRSNESFSSGSVRKQNRLSEAVRAAEKSLEEAEHAARAKVQAIEDIMADLNSNYGDQDVLRAMKDVCINNVIGDYTYEICFNGQATQKGKDVNTNIGSFDSFVFQDDGSVLIQFERGTKCWNGPIRRTTVSLTCGAENALLMVSEPHMCEYFIKAHSPAVCMEADRDAIIHESQSHDDL